MRTSPSHAGRRRTALVATALLTAATSSVLGLAGPAQAADSVAYPQSVPAWATSAHDAGAAAADTTVEGEVFLRLKDPAGAAELAAAVSTPGSPHYRDYVSPQEWIDRFSPPADVYDALLTVLKYDGVTIVGTPESRLFVVFRATAAQVSAAFGTTLHSYSVAGHRLLAPSSAPRLRSDLAASVSGMELDQGRLLTRPDSIPAGGSRSDSPRSAPKAGTAAAADQISCSHFYGEHTATLPEAYGQTTFPTYLCGYVPSQLRSAYGVQSTNPVVLTSSGQPASEPAPGGLTGAGQTVAIIDAYASPTILDDVNTYSQRRGEPALTNYRQIVPETFYDQAICQEPSGWQSEQTLDVEAVHGIAPAAGVLYVGGFNCGGGIDVALSRILDRGLATIVSNSYGDVGEVVPPDAIMGQENQHMQAAAEGIGLYYSSGDFGDESTAGLPPQPDYEASSPWVTAVGGTSTGIAEDGHVAVETGWGSHRLQVVDGKYAVVGTDGSVTPTDPPGPFRFGAGGGRSTIFRQPAYQKGIVQDDLARGMRVSPDIAADADPYTGMLIGLRPIVDDATLKTGDYVEQDIGGTSLASPLVAAQMALVQQLTGIRVGFANPALYDLHRATPSVPRDVAYTDVFPLAFQSVATPTSPSAQYLVSGNLDNSLKVTKGYDDVTGLGAIDFAFLRQAMSRS